MIKKIIYFIEYLVFKFSKALLTIIGFKNSSDLGGFIFKKFGPYTNYYKIIKKNMRLVYDNKKDLKKNALMNLEQTGKTFFEFLVLKDNKKHISSIINEHYLKQIKDNNQSCFFLSAHYGNWEITRNYLVSYGFKIHSVYRHANNIFIDNEIQKIRKLPGAFFYKKGKESAKHMVKAIKNNEHIAILIDQKDSSGKKINFFNQYALTNTGFASLSLKYKKTICLLRSVRVPDGSFKIIIEKPINIKELKGISDKELTQMIYKNYIEKWIKEDPTQWLWAHKRW